MTWRTPTLPEREARLAYALIIPTFVIVAGLVIFPAFFSIWISFHDVGLDNLNDVFHAPFVAFENYARVINDYAFPDALMTSVIYSFAATMASVSVGLIAALVLNHRFRGRGLVRAIFLFPYIAPVISAAFIWRWLFDPTIRGVANWLLVNGNVVEEPMGWFGKTGLALIMVVIFEAWRYFPFAMLMILARLQAVDETLYEAAAVDGANAWHKFWSITLPELRYVLGTLFLLRLMWTFNKFDDIFLLTSGGFGTKVLPILTYEFSFKLFDFGRGAATAMVLFIILVGFMFFYIKRVLEW
ncbi:MAG: sugar ABC transporter permease [Chloroflexi bacterium]|nr:sugar ABC transporter permease [Chloroflexota bacterium]